MRKHGFSLVLDTPPSLRRGGSFVLLFLFVVLCGYRGTPAYGYESTLPYDSPFYGSVCGSTTLHFDEMAHFTTSIGEEWVMYFPTCAPDYCPEEHGVPVIYKWPVEGGYTLMSPLAAFPYQLISASWVFQNCGAPGGYITNLIALSKEAINPFDPTDTWSANTTFDLSFGKPTTVPKNQQCDYASKNCAVKGSYHTGIDYSGNGTAVAVAYGTVVRIEKMSSSDHGMGNNVILRHVLSDGSVIFSTYSHLASIDSGILENQSVDKGQTIGVLGCTGYNDQYYWCRNTKKQVVYSPHLHFEIKTAMVTGNPEGLGKQNSTCKANANNAGVNTCWGYVGSKLVPDDYGYINPNLYLP